MSQRFQCRCGWEGSVDTAGHGPQRCPACHEPLAAGASSAAAAISSPPAVLPPAAPGGKGPAILQQALRIVRLVLGYVFFALQFYVQRRGAIWSGWRVWINENMPSFDTPDAIRREIRISLDEQEGVHEENGVWHVELPARCVVCGGKPNADRIQEPRTVLDPYGPIVGPLAGVILGVYLTWWNGSLMWLLGSIFAGILVGYAGRKEVSFLLKFQRCGKHLQPGRVPEVVVLHRQLVIRVGSRDVKLAFMQRDRDIGPMDEIALPTEMIVAPPHELIALADEVHPGAGIVPEQSVRLPTAVDEDAPHTAGPDEYRLSK